MAQCPSCIKDIEVDFGIVICPHCQTTLMFDIEGNPKVYEEITTHTSVQDLVLKETGQILNEEPVEQENIIPQEELVSEQYTTPQAEPIAEENIESLFEPLEEQVVRSEDEAKNIDLEAPVEEDLEITQNNIPIEGEVRFDDVIEFGNQELSGEALMYDVLIEDIDLSEIRKQLKELLADSKLNLGFDVEKNIKSGVLKIEKINAIKASVIIHSCQALPVKISWRQYAVANI